MISASASKKGGLQAAFFLWCLWLGAVCGATGIASASTRADPAQLAAWEARATQLGLEREPVWHALLHLTAGQPNITSPDFLLSAPRFSPGAELAATLKFLYGGDASTVCRFPARYLWLAERLALPPLPLEACAELAEFKARAPADRLTVVFASENLAQPSSMMGHVLLRLAGRTAQGGNVEHAISFITDTSDVNLAQLFYESMVVGKEGFFTLAPYEEKVDLYLRREQRSLWEYDLVLEPAGRDRLIAHLMELKQTRMTYLFQRYNCATVIDFLLAIGAGRSLPVEGFWLTPKDVAKRATALGIVGQSRVRPPNRWLIHALTSQLPTATVQQVRAQVEALQPPPAETGNAEADFLRDQLAKAYQAYRIETGQVSGPAVQAHSALLGAQLETRHAGTSLVSEAFKDPVNAPDDSQALFAFLRRGETDYVKLAVTPASHDLASDNRSYFAESQLQLFEVVLLQTLQRSRAPRLQRFTLYGAKSLVPITTLSSAWSGAFRMGMERRPVAGFNERSAVFVEGALGGTWRPQKDVDFYALAGASLTHQAGRTRLNVEPELGLVMRQVFDMKSVLSTQWRQPLGGGGDGYRKTSFTQAKYLPGGRWNARVQLDWERMAAASRRSVELAAQFVF